MQPFVATDTSRSSHDFSDQFSSSKNRDEIESTAPSTPTSANHSITVQELKPIQDEMCLKAEQTRVKEEFAAALKRISLMMQQKAASIERLKTMETEVAKMEKQYNQHNERLQRLRAFLVSGETEMNEITKRKKVLEEETGELKNSIDALSKDKNILTEEMEAVSVQTDLMKGKMKYLIAERDAAEKEAVSISESISEALKIAEKGRGECVALEKEINNVNMKRDKLVSDLDYLSTQETKLRDEVVQRSKDLNLLGEQLQTLSEQNSIAEGELTSKRQDLASSRYSLKEVEDSIALNEGKILSHKKTVVSQWESVEDDIKLMKIKIKSKEDEKAMLQRNIEELKCTTSELETEAISIRSKLGQLTSEKNELVDQLKELEVELDTVKKAKREEVENMDYELAILERQLEALSLQKIAYHESMRQSEDAVTELKDRISNLDQFKEKLAREAQELITDSKVFDCFDVCGQEGFCLEEMAHDVESVGFGKAMPSIEAGHIGTPYNQKPVAKAEKAEMGMSVQKLGEIVSEMRGSAVKLEFDQDTLSIKCKELRNVEQEDLESEQNHAKLKKGKSVDVAITEKSVKFASDEANADGLINLASNEELEKIVVVTEKQNPQCQVSASEAQLRKKLLKQTHQHPELKSENDISPHQCCNTKSQLFGPINLSVPREEETEHTEKLTRTIEQPNDQGSLLMENEVDVTSEVQQETSAVKSTEESITPECKRNELEVQVNNSETTISTIKIDEILSNQILQKITQVECQSNELSRNESTVESTIGELEAFISCTLLPKEAKLKSIINVLEDSIATLEKQVRGLEAKRGELSTTTETLARSVEVMAVSKIPGTDLSKEPHYTTPKGEVKKLDQTEVKVDSSKKQSRLVPARRKQLRKRKIVGTSDVISNEGALQLKQKLAEMTATARNLFYFIAALFIFAIVDYVTQKATVMNHISIISFFFILYFCRYLFFVQL